MSGRVLSDEEITGIEKRYVTNASVYRYSDMLANTIATIRYLQRQLYDRDNKIFELHSGRDMYKSQMEYWRSSSDEFANVIQRLRGQNTILLEALEAIQHTGDGLGWMARNKAREALVKVKGGSI